VVKLEISKFAVPDGQRGDAFAPLVWYYPRMSQAAASPTSDRRFPFQPPQNVRVLASTFLAISLLISLAFLSVRNIYDDEYSSLTFVDSSVSQIIKEANSGDVHPPGMYLLAHFAYQAIPSPRWMTLFTLLVLYAGLSVFAITVAPLFANLRGRACFLLLATLHPQLLMWGNTIRWYGWWTGLALVTLVLALQPEPSTMKPQLTYIRSVLLGLLLACLFYVNYITLIFIVPLSLAMVVRYSWRAYKQYLVVFTVFVSLIIPQLHAFLAVHSVNSKGQRSGFLLSFARLIEAIVCSEAYLPWHPLAILSALTFLFLAIVGVRKVTGLLRSPASSVAAWKAHNSLFSIVLFSLVFFALIALSGLGVKPRNGLLLLPLLAPLAALLVDTLRPFWAQYAFIGIFGLWSAVGAEHLLLRQGLAKANFINRPEEVISFLRDTRGSDCSVVVTYDPLLTLTLATSNLQHLLVLSPYQSPVYPHSRTFDSTQCSIFDLYLVTSYRGGFGRSGDILAAEMDAAARTARGPWQTHQFSLDPDAAHKRKLSFISGASDLPDYRYTITSTQIAASGLSTIDRDLPHFAVADGQSKPAEVFSASRVP